MASSDATTLGTHAPEASRRDFLYIATGTVAAVGAVATAIPFIAQMNPDASTLAAGGPVDLDVSKIAPGQQVVIRWRERPIFVFHRTPETLKTLDDPKLLSQLSDPNSQQMQQPPYAANATRSIKPEFGVLVGICTHLGCIPMFYPQPNLTSPVSNWRGQIGLRVEHRDAAEMRANADEHAEFRLDRARRIGGVGGLLHLLRIRIGQL